jgi:energy-coupling factor transport system permease protein
MRYVVAASPLHAARASVAVGWCAALTGVALAFDHPLVSAAVVLAATVAAARAGVTRELRGALRLGVVLAVMFAFANAIVTRDGLTVLLRFGEVPPFGQLDVTLEALVYGALQGARILAVIAAVALYASAVDPDRVLGLFRRAGFRSALTATLATRLVPVLRRDGHRLADAQRCRARPAGRLAIVRAVASGSLERAVDVAATLEVRGYGNARRGRAAREPWSRHDLAFAASAVALAAIGTWAVLAHTFAWDAYPELHLTAGPRQLIAAAAIVAVALLPFAERRGIER